MQRAFTDKLICGEDAKVEFFFFFSAARGFHCRVAFTIKEYS